MALIRYSTFNWRCRLSTHAVLAGIQTVAGVAIVLAWNTLVEREVQARKAVHTFVSCAEVVVIAASTDAAASVGSTLLPVASCEEARAVIRTGVSTRTGSAYASTAIVAALSASAVSLAYTNAVNATGILIVAVFVLHTPLPRLRQAAIVVDVGTGVAK